MRVLLFFGGPSEERDVSAGSIKPWVTYLQADPTAEVTVVFVDRALRAYRVPPAYYYANTCADFETQLRTDDLELGWDDVADLATLVPDLDLSLWPAFADRGAAR